MTMIEFKKKYPKAYLVLLVDRSEVVEKKIVDLKGNAIGETKTKEENVYMIYQGKASEAPSVLDNDEINYHFVKQDALSFPKEAWAIDLNQARF